MFMDQLVLPYQHHFLDDTTQTAIPLKLNQFIKDRFNASQQLAIRSITAATSKDFVCTREVRECKEIEGEGAGDEGRSAKRKGRLAK